MSADERDTDEDEQLTQFYGAARGSAPESTRTISPERHAELMAGVRLGGAGSGTAVPPTGADAQPALRRTRPPLPPPLPSMRAAETPAEAPRLEVEPVAAWVPPSVHSARATAALLESLESLEAAEDHLRRCGVGSPDLAIARQLVLGVLDGVHRRGWAS